MRALTVPLFTLLLATAGCASTAAPPRYAGPNPGDLNPGGYQGGYAQPQGAAPWGQPQPQGPSLLPPPIFRQVNVPALLAMQGRVPCAPKEVAPGTWATFDCGPFQAITRVIQYFPMTRLNFLPGGPLPAGVDHRVEGLEGPIKDQGAVGNCTAVSLSAAMDNAVRRMGRQDVVSALHIWSNYGTPVMRNAGDSNVDKSITLEQTWQYDAAKACKLSKVPFDTCSTAYGVASATEGFDPQLKAERANAEANGRYKLTAIEQLKAKPADPNEIAGVLAGGDDIWISFSVNDEAWKSKALQNAVIPDYDVVEDVGHAVVLAGYRTLPNGTKQFLIHNSWGPRWGDNGYGWISEAMVAKYTRAAYRVRVSDGSGALPVPGTPAPNKAPASGDCPAGQVKEPVFNTCIPAGIPGFPVPGQSPAPAPSSPQQQPQSGACPQGQAKDLMTGQCTNLCPSGTPSAGGMCLPALPR
jgi:hypothetical protein